MFFDLRVHPAGQATPPAPPASRAPATPFGSAADGDLPDAWGCEAAWPFLDSVVAFTPGEGGADPVL